MQSTIGIKVTFQQHEVIGSEDLGFSNIDFQWVVDVINNLHIP